MSADWLGTVALGLSCLALVLGYLRQPSLVPASRAEDLQRMVTALQAEVSRLAGRVSQLESENSMLRSDNEWLRADNRRLRNDRPGHGRAC